MLKTQAFTCRMAPFWKSVEDMSYFKSLDSPIIRPFPDLPSMAARYRQLTTTMTKNFKLLYCGQQLYVQDIYMDESDTHKYQLIWDINKAQRLIQQHQLPIDTIAIQHILPSIDHSKLTPAHLSVQKAKDNTPIIIVELTLTNQFVLIDGNHRVFSRFQHRINADIPCYLLTYDMMLQALADPKFVQLYQMHHNLYVIANYMFGNIPDVSYDSSERNRKIRLYDI